MKNLIHSGGKSMERAVVLDNQIRLLWTAYSLIHPGARLSDKKWLQWCKIYLRFSDFSFFKYVKTTYREFFDDEL